MKYTDKIINIVSFSSFSRREAEMIAYLLDKKELSISSLSHLMRLARPSIYLIADLLVKRHVIAPRKKGKRVYYGISKHFNLNSLYRTALNETNKILKLSPVKVSDINTTPTFKTLNEFLNLALRLKRGEIIYSVETPEDIAELFSGKYSNWVKRWQTEVAKKGVVLKGMSNPRGLEIFNKTSKNMLDLLSKRSGSARFLNDLEVRTSIVSFGDYLCFFSRKRNDFVVIKDQNIAVTIQSILDFLYSLSEYRDIYIQK